MILKNNSTSKREVRQEDLKQPTSSGVFLEIRSLLATTSSWERAKLERT